MSTSSLTSNHLEALKLVKDWSSGLIVVQSAAIGVIGTFLKQPPTGMYGVLTASLLTSLISSIVVGAVWVVGAIPYIAQELPSLLQSNPKFSIYAQRGGKKGDRTLGTMCEIQIFLFVSSLILFSLFVFFAPPGSE